MNVWEFLSLIIIVIFLFKNQNNDNQYFGNLLKDAYKLFASEFTRELLLHLLLVVFIASIFATSSAFIFFILKGS